MILLCKGHTYKYESEKIVRAFYPAEKIFFEPAASPADGRILTAALEKRADAVRFSCKAAIDGKEAEKTETFKKEELRISEESALARVIYDALSEITGLSPPWGVLTGVRPAKLMRRLLAEVGDAAADIFREDFKVREDKVRLALDVAAAEEAGIRLSKEDSFSLYVSIPFCPTRCSYCSFVSHSVAAAKKLIPDYVRLLCEEIKHTSEIAGRLGLRLETVYFGGGTPTSLSSEDLKRITCAVGESFDLSRIREYTVEAGRPDTVDEEKLRVLKDAGVSRISINPQTFSDSVLREIGRRHSSRDTLEKFRLARSLGFDNINMDFIAGLPTDTPESFRESMGTAVELAPENITVHTLALKRAARIVTEGENTENGGVTADMVEYANALLTKSGYAPYYMYRQSKSLGNLENVGWTKENKACLYNIYMMEEVHSVLACGAGAVTKLRDPKGEAIERVYNFKYPYEYIGRFEELTERKTAVESFYHQLQSPGKGKRNG